MTAADIRAKYEEYEGLIKNLKLVIVASRDRVVQEQPDQLFLDNLNFFTKAYLVSLCTSLEAYLQDISFAFLGLIKQRLASARVPNNVVRWALLKEVKNNDLHFSDFVLATGRKELADELSGNPGKTIALFRYIGVDLQSNAVFQTHRDVVGAVVAKRNSIVHHNDSAADTSMDDLLNYADQFLLYMEAVCDCVSSACS